MDERETIEGALSDEELVLQSQKGELSAFDQLVRRYHLKIYGLVYHLTGNREDAEDLVQETFVRAYTKLGSFRESTPFYTWIYRMAIARTARFSKKRTRSQTTRLDDINSALKKDPLFVRLVAEHATLRRMKLNQWQKQMNRAMQVLSEQDRQVIVLHDVQSIPHDAIAKILRCSVVVVRARLLGAREVLSEELAGFSS